MVVALELAFEERDFLLEYHIHFGKYVNIKKVFYHVTPRG
jgi:hypothetical protein